MKYKRIFVPAIAAVLVLAVPAGGVGPERKPAPPAPGGGKKAPCMDHDDSIFCTHLSLKETAADARLPEPVTGADQSLSRQERLDGDCFYTESAGNFEIFPACAGKITAFSNWTAAGPLISPKTLTEHFLKSARSDVEYIRRKENRFQAQQRMSGWLENHHFISSSVSRIISGASFLRCFFVT